MSYEDARKELLAIAGECELPLAKAKGLLAHFR